jgi:hypothetical protein
MNYLADKSYLAIRPQNVAGRATIPSVFAPLISEGVRVNPNLAADRRIMGLDWKSDELLKGPRVIEGELKFFADPDVLAHILNMVYSKVSTTGNASDGYVHTFEPGDGKSYTIEISRGDYAQRIFGVRGDQVVLGFEDNKLTAAITIKALGQFYSASLAVALTGAGMTQLVLSTDYDLEPNKGLRVGDTLIIGSTEIEITSVDADGKTIGFDATSITASIGDPVFLKAQTPTYGTKREPLYLGNTLVGFGDDETEASVNAASRSLATPCYDMEITLKNNLFDSPASGSTGPSVLLNQVKEAQISLSRLFEDPTEYQRFIESVKKAMTSITTGRFIKSDLTTSEKLTVKFYKVKMTNNEEPLEVGSHIMDNQTFEALYDPDEDAAVSIELINRVSGDDLENDEES